MLTQLFRAFQDDVTDTSSFEKLANALKVKMLSIFASIACPHSFRDDYLQCCYIKIIEVVRDKHFDEHNLNDRILSRYFERAFLTVKTKFIKEHGLYLNSVSLDAEDENGITLLEKISGDDIAINHQASDMPLKDIKAFVSKQDYVFLTLFIDQQSQKMRNVTDVAKLLGVSHQAVSKRFKRIKEKINNTIAHSSRR